MNPENFTQAELAEIGAKALSHNYGGDEYEAFTGSNDASLDFHGQASNLKEEAKGHVGFRCQVKNKLKRDLTVVILPAYFIDIMYTRMSMLASDNSYLYRLQQIIITHLSENGITADIIMIDGQWFSQTVKPGEGENPETETYKVFAEVTSSLPGKTVAGFIAFCQKNPTRIPEILIASNTTDTYTQVMRIRPVSPARDLGEKTIYLGEYFDQKNNRVDYITVPTDKFGKTGLQFDDQTLIIMNVPAATDSADTVVNFTFKFGVSLNSASELATKAAIAKSDVPVMIAKSTVNVPAIKAALNS